MSADAVPAAAGSEPGRAGAATESRNHRQAPRQSRLGPGPEFDLIRFLHADTPAPGPDIVLGSGDDCAVLDAGWVVSTDAFVEDVHFRRRWIGLDEAAYRAVTAGLSDLAAMAARAVGVLVTLSLPRPEARSLMPGLRAGIRRACERSACALLGGDLTRSPGPVMMNVVALGRTRRPLRRSAAQPGDEVWVTGTLGASAAAVSLWRSGRDPDPELRRSFAEPVARLEEARWLARRLPVTAMVDISDGLRGDAGHIAAASGAGIVLDMDLLPVRAATLSAAPTAREAARWALDGGEDYELCFTVPSGRGDSVVAPFRRTFGVELTRVGRVTGGAGVLLARGGVEVAEDGRASFDHFGSGQGRG